MKSVNVLLTCSSFHAVGIIDCLKDNPDNVPVKVFVTNCNVADLPPEKCCDGTFVVPKIDDEGYIPYLMQLCRINAIDIIFPTSSLELDLMARYKEVFNDNGVKVSVSSLDAVMVAGDKIKTWQRFKQYMPQQTVAMNALDVLEFSHKVPNICCKPVSLCGGKGFAVVDEEKCTDVSLFHGYGKKHYISLWQLCKAVEKYQQPMILQEYQSGMDFSILALAVNGKLLYCCGNYATKLEFGSTVEGEIGMHPYAKKIAQKVIERLNIDGIVGFDFILLSDGSAKLLDINLRVTASAQFYAKAGCNIPWLRCKQLLGYDISKESISIDYGLNMVKYFDAHYFHN